MSATGENDTPRWSFLAEPLSDDGTAIVVRVRAGDLVDGPEPWAWPADGTIYYWRARPFSVLVTTRAGRFPYWYCPIHTPPAVTAGQLRVVDLGHDVQLFADGRYSVRGDEQSREPDNANTVAAAVREIIAAIKERTPPFDHLGARQRQVQPPAVRRST